jgi:uridylate kinase
MDRVQGDYMGMLATVINSLTLQSALERKASNKAVTESMKLLWCCTKTDAITI